MCSSSQPAIAHLCAIQVTSAGAGMVSEYDGAWDKAMDKTSVSDEVGREPLKLIIWGRFEEQGLELDVMQADKSSQPNYASMWRGGILSEHCPPA